METVNTLTVFLYLLSTAGYLMYLFLQKNFLQKTGYGLLLAGFILHSIYIIFAFTQTGQIPATNLRDTLCLAGWALAGVFVVIQYRYNIKILGIYAAPCITLIMVIVAYLPSEPTQAKTLFKSIWLVSHIIVIFIGEAAFALACGFHGLPAAFAGRGRILASIVRSAGIASSGPGAVTKGGSRWSWFPDRLGRFPGRLSMGMDSPIVSIR